MSAGRVFRIDRIPGALRVLDAGAADVGSGSGDTWAKIDASTGHLHGRARIARTGVQIYSDGERTWGEFRDEAEVFSDAAIESFRRLVMTDSHPAEFVDSKNSGELQIGHLGDDLRRDGRWLTASFTITDAGTIERARAGKVELSMGYWSQPVADTGTHDGDAFEFRQTQLRGNHQAIVDVARAGAEARIPQFDSETSVAWSVTQKEDDMFDKTNKTEAPAQPVADATPAPVAVPTADAATLARLDSLEADNAKLRGELAEQEADSAAKIDRRVALLSRARAAAPSLELDGKSDAEIQRAVLDAIAPDMAAKLDTRADVPGYLEAVFDLKVSEKADTAAAVADGFNAAARASEKGSAVAPGDQFAQETADAAASFTSRTLGLVSDLKVS